jgi:hypothetical protein
MSWFDGGCAVDGLEKGCVDRIIGERLRSWGDFTIKHCDKALASGWPFDKALI